MAGALAACTAIGVNETRAQTPPAHGSADSGRRPVAELPVRRFDIPAGKLDAAIALFEAQSGVRLTIAVDRGILRVLDTAGIAGTMPVEQALSELLRLSGLEHRFIGRRAATIGLPAAAESIDVSAPAPQVASPKFTQSLLETPQSITVIPDEVFLEQGATTLRDVLRNTPGITFQAGEGGGGLPGDNFSMRGFSASNDVTVDGIREVGAYTRDAFTLEQVEVFKGPTSATAGRGSTGGSINLVTKTPKPEPFRRATASAGTNGYTRFTADWNEPLEAWDSAALRFNAMVTSSGVAGRDVVENNSWGLSPSLTLGVGKMSRFTLSYQYLEQNNVPDYGLPWAAFESSPRADQSNFYGLEDYDYEDVSSRIATAAFESQLGGWLLRNVLRHGDNHRDSAITAPRPPNRQLQQRRIDNMQLANQTSLTGSFSTGPAHHSLSSGVEVAREQRENRNQSQTTNQPQTTLTDPNPADRPFGPMPENLGNPEHTSLDLLGAWALDTIDLGARWQVSGGLRWDVVDVDYTLQNRATGITTELGRRDSMLSWNAGALFKPSAHASVYASAATSFNPSVESGNVGASLSDVPTAANNVNLAPEKSRNLEVGGKWETPSGRAAATLAIFRTEKTNARTRNATTEPFVLAGRQRVDGVELGVNGVITPNWTIFAGYLHLDSEFVESANPAETGAELALSPEHSFNVWTTAKVGRRVSIGGGVQYMDAVFRNAINTTTVPAYWLASAMASYDVNPALTLRLNVNNLTDTVFVDRVGGGHYVPGPRRSIALSAEVDF